MLELELAGAGSRVAAAAVDGLILIGLFLLINVAFTFGGVAGGTVRAWYGAVLVVVGFALTWGYFTLFEALGNGRTPGKRYIGIRVVMDTGHPITMGAAVIRNLVRIADALFFFFLGLAFILFHSENKRLGDIVAGTIVVRDRPEDLQLVTQGVVPQGAVEDASGDEVLEAGSPELAEDEYRLLDQFLHRAAELDAGRRHQLRDELVARFAPRVPRRDADPETFLVQLHAAEFRRRRGRLATRRPSGVGHTSVAAERFVARKQASWEAFRAEAVRAERAGLKSLGAREIPGFAARYRALAADLARARTYGVDARVLEYLERVVSAGHNAIYGTPGVRRPALGRLVFGEFPAAVIAARRYVVAAFLFFAVPAATGYLVLRERPTAAYELLPDEMIARAAAGRARRAEGIGYAEAPSPYLPLIASSIVRNNVQIAFAAFAFGVLAGVGTIFVLVSNGLFFGAVLGLFANYGLADWLLRFVAGHGVLELTAIFIAGGAGLLIGRTIIAPGDLRRRDALVLAGQRAVRMVGAAACLLLLAGTIEGFLSASDAPQAYKFAASGLSAVLIALYLAAGWRHLGRSALEVAQPDRGPA